MSWLWLLLFNKVYQSTILLRVYKFYKFLARLTTGTTEIYRICYAASIQLGWQTGLESALDEKTDDDSLTTPLLETHVPAHIIYRIDRSILYSKQLTAERRELESDTCDVDQVLRGILAKKQFPSRSSQSPAARVLRICLIRIAETHQLTREINERAHTKYDSTNPLHEQKLMRLWKALLPDTELESRLTRQWAEIGFQGNDPATDFRGMGMQGLDDLVYYTQQHPRSAQKTFTSSRHPISWYPFAIVGINISQFAVQMLRTRQLQFYLFEHGTDKKTFNEFYCYLFHTFNEFWISHDEPKLTVMDFEMKFKEFKAIVGKDLMMLRVVPLSVLQVGRKEDVEQQEASSDKIELQDTLRQRKPITMS